MAVALHSYKIDPDGEIRVRHTFYADTADEADELMEKHAEGCRAFGPALEAGETIEVIEDIDEDELPDADELRDLEDEQNDEDEEEEVTE